MCLINLMPPSPHKISLNVPILYFKIRHVIFVISILIAKLFSKIYVGMCLINFMPPSPHKISLNVFTIKII